MRAKEDRLVANCRQAITPRADLQKAAIPVGLDQEAHDEQRKHHQAEYREAAINHQSTAAVDGRTAVKPISKRANGQVSDAHRQR
jgi:hypothetical protein